MRQAVGRYVRAAVSAARVLFALGDAAHQKGIQLRHKSDVEHIQRMHIAMHAAIYHSITKQLQQNAIE